MLCAAVLAPPARGVDPKAVDRAIARGVRHLRLLQGADGAWPYLDDRMAAPYADTGMTALAGLTLLECGAPGDDRAVERAARHVRDASIECTGTYSISLAILFLDRLGDPDDIPLIESLAVRLLAGQNDQGGWSYSCPAIPADEARRLTALVRARRELVGRRAPPAPGGRPAPREVSPEIREQLGRLRRDAVRMPGYGDNSNTQFATLALWVARRYSLPVEDALAQIDSRFRKTQSADGGWPYGEPPSGARVRGRGWRRMAGPEILPDRSGAMAAAGLLGLAVAHGLAVGSEEADAVRKDPAVRSGLMALARETSYLSHPPGGQVPVLGRDSYYLLWSMERVCAAMGLKTLGNRDWYAWGARLLLHNQQPNGSWVGNYGRQGADTCFALLFLKQSNLAGDLTSQLRGKVRDPGEAILKSGGVGGKDLADVGKPPAEPDRVEKPLAPADKPAPPAPPPRRTAPPPAPPPARRAPAPPPPAVEPTPAAPAEVTPGRLADEMVKAPAGERAATLRRLQEGKGVEFTEALAGAVGRLDGEARQQAREALSSRLARMKSDVLERYLADDEPELRRAAALACAMKELKSQIPRLIPLLSDRDKAVSAAALAALRALSAQKFGPDPVVWQAWWDRQDRD
jgi:hypothetical protein